MNRLALLVASAFFMEFLDGTIITTALPSMAQSLGTTAVGLHIGITAYLLAVAVFILPGGWVADRLGARTVFTGAVAVFTAGSVLCGLATSVEGFVAARVVQGLGGAMMVPVGRLVVLRTTERHDLMRVTALLTWPGLTAPLLGPPLGGLIAEHLSWRWIFLVNLPLGLAGVGWALRLVPRLAGGERRPFDGVGFGLGATSLLCAVGAIDLLGRGVVPWLAVASLAGVAGVAGLLLRRQARRHPHPMLDPAPLRVATFRMVITNGTGIRVLISAMPFLLPLLFQLGFGFDAVRAGLLTMALFAGNIGMKPLTSPILRRCGFRNVLVGNGVLQGATMLACAALTPATPTAVVVALLVVSGASRSLQFTALNTLAFADVPKPLMSAANILFSVAFQLAIGLGVALGAVALRASGHLLGDGAVPSLATFHGAFGIVGVLTVVTALAGLRMAGDAGASVSGRAAAGR